MTDRSPRRQEPSTGSTPSNSSTTHAGDSAQPGGPKWRIVALVVVIALIITAIAVIFIQRNNDSDSAGGAASSTTATTTSSTSGIPAASAAKKGPVPAGCMKTPKPIVPVKYSIDGMKASAKVLSRGVDETGAAGAPPKNDPSSMAWFNQGPKIGSDKGNAVSVSYTHLTLPTIYSV